MHTPEADLYKKYPRVTYGISDLCLTSVLYLRLYFDIRLFIQLVLIQGIYIYVAILPFDIRDLDSDSPCLNTIPQKLGVSKSKTLGYVLLFVNSIFTIICFDFISPMVLSSIPSFILLAFLLKLSYPNKSKYLSSLWVESIPFFWAGSFYLFT